MSPRRALLGTLVLLNLLVPAAARAQITAYAVVVNDSADTVSVIDTRTEQMVGPPIHVLPGPHAVTMSPDGRRAYVSHSGKAALTVIDVAQHKKEAEITLPFASRAVAVSPDNRWVYVVHGMLSGDMSIVSAQSLVLMPFTATVGLQPTCIAVTPNRRYAYICDRGSQEVAVVELTLPTPTVITTIPVTMEPVQIAIAPDGLTGYLRERLLLFAGAIVPIDLTTNTLRSASALAVNSGWKMTLTYDASLLYAIGTGFSTTAAVFETATGSGVGSIPLSAGAVDIAATPNGNFVYVTDALSSSVAIIDRWTQTLTGRSIAVGNPPGDLGIGPSVIIRPAGASVVPVSIARDSDLTTRNFGSFVPFNGGTLKTTGIWTTTRTVSLLQGGGTIETHASATVNAGTIGPGVLTKTGPSVLTLMGNAGHPHTIVKDGVLAVMSMHLGDITVDGGTLAGIGTVGQVTATRGAIAPSGGTSGPGVLHAATVTMGPATTFAVTMVGPAEGSYSRLDATNLVDLGNATLTVNPKFTPLPGQTFTIVTNAIGEFANYTEGDIIITPRGSFRITYQAGPMGQDVVLTTL